MNKNLHFSDALKLKGPDAFHVMLKPAGSSCNFDCKYCYYLEKRKLYSEEKKFMMSTELLEEFTRQFIEANNIPVVTFTWQGGEPTLMGLDFYIKAIGLQKKYSNGKRIENSFQTNGSRLNDEWCKFFHDNNVLVGISIDGPEHIHNHYRKTKSGGDTFGSVMKGIELLQRNKVEFNTLSCVNDYSVHYAVDIYRFLKSSGSVFMQFLPVVERNAKIKDVNKLSLVSNDYREEAEVTEWSVKGKDFGKFLISIFDEWVRNDVGNRFVQIFDSTLANWVGEMPGICVFSDTCGEALALEHNGDLYSCDHFVYNDNYLGNILEKPLIDLVKSQNQFNFGIKKRNSLPRHCLLCNVRFACNGECPKHRILNAPDGEYGLNYLCDGYKIFFQHVQPYMDFMAKELENSRAPSNVMKWIRNRETQAVKLVLPERNSQCPCGSGKKYKNCCGLNSNHIISK
jgi:uncharacterized protein